MPRAPTRQCQVRVIPVLGTRCLLVICFMLGVLNAENLLDFPGHVICLNDSMRITLPRLLGDSLWEEVYILNSQGEEIDCKSVVNRQNLQMIVHNDCLNYQGSSKYITIQFVIHSNVTESKPTYRISCEGIQGDGEYSLPQVNCSLHFMSIRLSHLLPDFKDPVGSRRLAATWYLEVTDPVAHKTYTWTTSQAVQQGYSILSDPVSHEFVVRVLHNATGVQKFQQNGHSLYLADLGLFFYFYNQRLQVGATMICLPGPHVCNGTHLAILIPQFPAVLSAINLDGMDIQMNQLAQNGITISANKGTQLYIDRSFLRKCVSLQATVVSNLLLTFTYNGNPVLMSISPECKCFEPEPGVSICNPAGYMDFEVLAATTVPKLNLRTVRIRDVSCLPYDQSSDKLTFHIPLNGCGTTLTYVGGNLIYENEVRALWVDLPQSIIYRDSEYRMTVRCMFIGSGEAMVRQDVAPLTLVTLAASDGPINFALDLFPDNSYGNPYRANQYPVVKFLREPAYLEVRVLNRNDPNIELVLNDCWATAYLDPASLPRWDVIVDGCDNQNDNYRTVFHPVGFQVQYPSHRKRFEVQTFAFVSGGAAMSSLVYFHCTALVCNVMAPDSPLCTKRCPTSRRRREIPLSSKDHLVSLPGPVFFENEVSKINDRPMHEMEDYQVPAHLTEGAWSIVLLVLVCFTIVSVLIYKRQQTAKDNV